MATEESYVNERLDHLGLWPGCAKRLKRYYKVNRFCFLYLVISEWHR